ncbi:glucuronate isomerase [Colwellia sp. 1_MG-2023]|uniref:glucuronate isomerase n=1 Tax=Colwellia sp. 1_MG-2023 TaxID=3062649 RepID=UPI0026E2C950|nr:glucuronate isomerase [Colwellia sp. 1_MG-2023]MDO6446971.1 glucuronate isomerase [Colwellia sp. 1_MG-2023]
MAKKLQLHADRLFSSNEEIRNIARTLYRSVKDLPIISPHGHTDPAWFAHDQNFDNATDLLIKPDHYVFRMLYSQGITLAELGIETIAGESTETDNRKIWQLFAKHYYLFRGTPSKVWLDTVFAEIFNIDVVLCEETADYYYDTINALLKTDAFKPRALFERFNIEIISTTESPLNDLAHHKTINASDWQGKVISAYRPDPVIDPEFEGFVSAIKYFGEITGEDTSTFSGYLLAHKKRRAYFKATGVTSTDHGHPTAKTAYLERSDIEALYQVVISGQANAEQAELFRAHMLTEMAGMSVEDGLVMQLHPGVSRNHNQDVFTRFGRDKGADIPVQCSYTEQLKPLLDKYGTQPNFTFILFTLDETAYSRELAPLAGHYPCLRLGPPWWFHDSPEGMRRFRQQMTETAGFYNTVGFNDDTRAFLSIPARHDVARRMDCNWLAELVSDHRLTLDEAQELAVDLAYNLAKKAYKL